MTLSFRIVAVLPALNEAGVIQRVVRDIAQILPVIVVDDGSTDDTADLARDAGAFVIVNSDQRGYESALSCGLNKALRDGYTHAITMDADGQHSISNIEKFIEAIQCGFDLVVGRRNRRARITERIFSFVARKLWGITDPLCGMKGYKLFLLEEFGPFDTYKSVGTEFTLRLLRHGIDFLEVPVEISPRRGVSRFGGVIMGNYKIFRALIFAVIKYRLDRHPVID